ncbi:MAG: cytochrome c biogenesis protein CcsA [Pseudomonadales bacterium]|nr:cytochrome c biogenesis protein CcsA [Pseudomonadales bacterium]
MTSTIVGSTAIACYIGGAILQYYHLVRRDNSQRCRVLLLGALALLLHTVSFNGTVVTDAGLHLGFFKISSLIGWLITGLVLVSSIQKPLENLLIGVYPIAALGLGSAIIAHGTVEPTIHLSLHSVSHILLSLFAYSVLTIAAIQAVLLAWQDQQLHHKRANGFIMRLPPLQVMEQLLFELIWVGVVLLSAAIISGAFFIQDMFAQHLAHKTLLSIFAWLIFSLLLAGRHWKGWRGSIAIRWTIFGYLLLMLAYFGTKLVLEILLPPGS